MVNHNQWVAIKCAFHNIIIENKPFFSESIDLPLDIKHMVMLRSYTRLVQSTSSYCEIIVTKHSNTDRFYSGFIIAHIPSELTCVWFLVPRRLHLLFAIYFELPFHFSQTNEIQSCMCACVCGAFSLILATVTVNKCIIGISNTRSSAYLIIRERCYKMAKWAKQISCFVSIGSMETAWNQCQ